MEVLKQWFRRYFSDPQVVSLLLILLFAFILIRTLGSTLSPVLTAVVIAYLLQSPIRWFENLGIPSLISVILVFVLFLAVMVFILVWLIPELLQQVPTFFTEFPNFVDKSKKQLVEWLTSLEAKYKFVSNNEIEKIIADINNEFKVKGQEITKAVLNINNVQHVVFLLVFVLLLPLLVFFFLKDKGKIINWMKSFYPKDMGLTSTVWRDLNEQIGNYVRGKIFEILLVWLVTYIVFLSLGMPYPLLLAGMVGLSALIPYIGAVVVTIPVVLVAYATFNGFTPTFWWVIGLYALIQTVDGIVVVPLLFSEVVKLHPVAIVVAVLVFGGAWGFWGVFFAIPLASLVQAIINAWPRTAVLAKPP